MKILIHHHAKVFIDDDGVMWLPSFIGRWVNELANHFGGVDVLLYETIINNRQDVKVCEKVKLVSLGIQEEHNKFSKRQIIWNTGKANHKQYDWLLIRGETPMQFVVHRAYKDIRKAFLLVNSPNFSSQSFSPLGIFLTLIKLIRKFQLHYVLHRSHVFANSFSVKTDIYKKFGIKSNFVSTNSITESEFVGYDELIKKQISNPLKLLFCSRIVKSKGIVEALQVIKYLNENNIPANLDVVGTTIGDENLSDYINLANELGISEQVSWEGFVPFGINLMRYYRNAHIFLLPTYTEGFPHVIWEAFANGCVVITTRVGGIPSMVTHEEDCLLVSPQNHIQIAQSVKQLIEDKEKYSKMKLSSYELVKKFTLEKGAKKMATLLYQKSDARFEK